MSNVDTTHTTISFLLSLYAVIIFVILWLSALIHYIWNSDQIYSLWSDISSLPQVYRIVLWIVVTPFMVALWGWTNFDLSVRIIVVFVLTIWTYLALSSLVKYTGGIRNG